MTIEYTHKSSSTPLNFDTNSNSFSGEASSLGFRCGCTMPEKITIKIINNQHQKTFSFAGCKYYGHGEDREIASWDYKAKDGQEIIIFND